jgi:hypothetical protein
MIEQDSGEAPSLLRGAVKKIARLTPLRGIIAVRTFALMLLGVTRQHIGRQVGRTVLEE